VMRWSNVPSPASSVLSGLLLVADLLRDQAMIPEVQRLARHIHERYPQQAKALIERWMPETERYSNA
ncbi:hypothetical protein ACUOFC_45810, partial [Escherichia sp. TWPC-MK]